MSAEMRGYNETGTIVLYVHILIYAHILFIFTISAKGPENLQIQNDHVSVKAAI